MNLGNQPVEVLIEDVYLLVVPSPQGEENVAEEEQRKQAAKMERLENAELLHVSSRNDVSDGKHQLCAYFPNSDRVTEDTQKSQGLWSSLITKIVNNLQVTVKNVHIRYEDKLSVPGVNIPYFAGRFAIDIVIASFRGRNNPSRIYSNFYR